MKFKNIFNLIFAIALIAPNYLPLWAKAEPFFPMNINIPNVGFMFNQKGTGALQNSLGWQSSKSQSSKESSSNENFGFAQHGYNDNTNGMGSSIVVHNSKSNSQKLAQSNENFGFSSGSGNAVMMKSSKSNSQKESNSNENFGYMHLGNNANSTNGMGSSIVMQGSKSNTQKEADSNENFGLSSQGNHSNINGISAPVIMGGSKSNSQNESNPNEKIGYSNLSIKPNGNPLSTMAPSTSQSVTNSNENFANAKTDKNAAVNTTHTITRGSKSTAQVNSKKNTGYAEGNENAEVNRQSINVNTNNNYKDTRLGFNTTSTSLSNVSAVNNEFANGNVTKRWTPQKTTIVNKFPNGNNNQNSATLRQMGTSSLTGQPPPSYQKQPGSNKKLPYAHHGNNRDIIPTSHPLNLKSSNSNSINKPNSNINFKYVSPDNIGLNIPQKALNPYQNLQHANPGNKVKQTPNGYIKQNPAALPEPNHHKKPSPNKKLNLFSLNGHITFKLRSNSKNKTDSNAYRNNNGLKISRRSSPRMHSKQTIPQKLFNPHQNLNSARPVNVTDKIPSRNNNQNTAVLPKMSSSTLPAYQKQLSSNAQLQHVHQGNKEDVMQTGSTGLSYTQASAQTATKKSSSNGSNEYATADNNRLNSATTSSQMIQSKQLIPQKAINSNQNVGPAEPGTNANKLPSTNINQNPATLSQIGGSTMINGSRSNSEAKGSSSNDTSKNTYQGNNKNVIPTGSSLAMQRSKSNSLKESNSNENFAYTNLNRNGLKNIQALLPIKGFNLFPNLGGDNLENVAINNSMAMGGSRSHSKRETNSNESFGFAQQNNNSGMKTMGTSMVMHSSKSRSKKESSSHESFGYNIQHHNVLPAV